MIKPRARRGTSTRSRRRAPPAPRGSGRATKISVTVDAAVLDQTRQLLRRTGATLSAHVSEALARELRRRHLQRLIQEYEAENGVITEAELAEVRGRWQE